MAKVKLGNRPKNFKSTVSFPMLDEDGKPTTGVIEVSFIYRTRTEFAEYIDKVRAAAVAAAQAEVDALKASDAQKPVSVADLVKDALATSAVQILDVIDGWDLDEALDAAHVKQLANEIPAATAAIMEKYRTVIHEGRLEN
jgi:hypothetical protein